MSKKNKARRQHHQPSGQRSRAGRKPAKREVMLEIPAATGVTIDRENLHPSLRHLADDDQIGIIITTGGNPAPPEGAGALIGELKQDLRTSDGTILPEGSRVWADTRTGSLQERAALRASDQGGVIAGTSDGIIVGTTGDVIAGQLDTQPGAAVAEYRQRMAEGAIPAAFRARAKARGGTAADMVAALEDESKGLAQRLAQGLSPDELKELAPQIARAASIGGAEGAYTFTTGAQEGRRGDPALVIEGVPDEPSPEFGRRGTGSRKSGRTVADPVPAGRKTARQQEPVTSRFITKVEGKDGAVSGLQPGDIIAVTQPAGYAATGIPVPEGAGRPGDRVWRPRVVTTPAEELRNELGLVTRAVLDHAPAPRDPGDPALLALRASDVLDMHAQLADLMARPNEDILQYYGRFIQQTISEAHKSGGAERAREFWEGMFWPATSAREWTSILARLLSQARTYQVTAEMVDKVTAQYASDLVSGTYTIDSDDLPWPAGFAWLDAPLTFTDKFGKEGWNRAVSWGPEILQMGSRRVPGSRIVSWSWHDDHDGWWTENGAATMLRQGGLSMAHAISFPYNARLNVTRDAQGRATQDDTIRWTRTLWRVLSSEIAATRTDSHIERHVAKRALRSLKHNQVHVVTLRHKHYTSDGQPGHRDVRWTCQWPVNGFWRHVRRDEQWEEIHVERDGKGRRTRHHAVPDEFKENCAICGAPVSWIGAFTKGPPGAPWRDQSNRTVYRLAR